MRKLTRLFVLSGMIAMPTLALADDAASPTSANIAFTSHYVFRGLSQSWNRPVVQAGLDYVHPSGFYLGTWGSGVSDKIYNNASMEWDFYGGYNAKINDDLSWGVGAITVWYPGGHANNAASTKYNTTELNAQLTYKFLNLKYSYALTNLFGLNQDNPFNQPVSGDTKGSQYLEANVNYEIMDKLTLGAHLGHQKVANNSTYSYTDYKISLSKELPKAYFGLNVALAYSDTDAGNDVWVAASPSGTETKNLAGSTWSLSVSKTF